MAGIRIAVALALVFVLTEGCELNRQRIMQIAFSCAGKQAEEHPNFLSEVMALAAQQETSGGPPDIQKNMKWFCSNKEVIVDILRCVAAEAGECLPPQVKPVIALLTNKERMMEGIGFMCQHPKMMGNQCMQNSLPQFVECYRTRLMNVVAAEGRMSDPKQIICKFVRSEETCFVDNKGTCSDDYISTLVEMLETFFPMSDCPKSKDNKQLNTLLGALLMHGEPSLKFLPAHGYQPYVIKN